MLVFVTKDL